MVLCFALYRNIRCRRVLEECIHALLRLLYMCSVKRCGEEPWLLGSLLQDRELKQRRSWATHVNKKWTFSVLIFLDATKFLSLSVFTLIEKICVKFRSKSPLKRAKVHVRLTCVAQKRRGLNSTLARMWWYFVACLQIFATWSELCGLISDV